MKISKEEFISNYCRASGITWDELSKTRIALSCNCGEESCHGWAMIINNKDCIAAQFELYAPKESKYQ